MVALGPHLNLPEVPPQGFGRCLRPRVVVALGPHLNLPEAPPQDFGRYLRPQVVALLLIFIQNSPYRVF